MAAELLSPLGPSPIGPGVPTLRLFGGPYVVIRGRRRDLPEGTKRLLVFVALSGGWVERRAAAGTLWPIGNDVRAVGNLRSALWRLKGAGIDLIEGDRCALRLQGGTVTDLGVMSEWAARLIEGRPREDDMETAAWHPSPLPLLPGWYDDWVVFERERFRQRWMHGLEALSRCLVRARRFGEAVEAATTAIDQDPLRESAQRVLIEAHLADGNVVGALCAYDVYRAEVFRDLGVQPSAELTTLVERTTRPGARGELDREDVVVAPRMAVRTTTALTSHAMTRV